MAFLHVKRKNTSIKQSGCGAFPGSMFSVFWTRCFFVLVFVAFLTCDALDFSRKHREGFLVKKGCLSHTTTPIHRSRAPCHSLLSAYTARRVYTCYTTASTLLTHTTPTPLTIRRSIFSYTSKAGVGLASLGAANPLRVSCSRCGAVQISTSSGEPSAGVDICSRCGAVRISTSPAAPSAGFVRVETLSLWRRASS